CTLAWSGHVVRVAAGPGVDGGRAATVVAQSDVDVAAGNVHAAGHAAAAVLGRQALAALTHALERLGQPAHVQAALTAIVQQPVTAPPVEGLADVLPAAPAVPGAHVDAEILLDVLYRLGAGVAFETHGLTVA